MYNRKEYETQTSDTKCEVCGGTREALAIPKLAEDWQDPTMSPFCSHLSKRCHGCYGCKGNYC